MKIYSFDGKKKNIDNIDIYSSPLFLGQKFDCETAAEIEGAAEEAESPENTQN